MSPFDFLEDELVDVRRLGRTRTLVPRWTRGVTLVEPDGRELINFGSNDYLGLAAQGKSPSTSTGGTASALVCGWSPHHQSLADRIAALESTESAVVFPSGYAACSGTIAALANKDDLILSDELNHASLIDGCRLSSATRIVYPHRDCLAVGKALEKRRDEFARVWIVTDGVFSMDGHVAPLPTLCDLAERHDAILIVDEAHATGVLGQTGSGLCEEMNVKSRVPIRIGTLSKAVGGQGGFVAGPATVIEYLINRCRSLIFSTSLAPAAVQVAIDALESFAGSDRRDRVRSLSRRLRHRLSLTEVDPIESGVPIIPVPIGAESDAVAASRRLADAGFFVPAIRPPTVPEGGSRLRISLSAAHEESMIDALSTAVLAIRADLGPIARAGD